MNTAFDDTECMNDRENDDHHLYKSIENLPQIQFSSIAWNAVPCI